MLHKIEKVIRECGEIIKKANITSVEFKEQDRRNLLTEYDVNIQSILQKKLLEILPEASFLGEEGEQRYSKTGYCFVCDPIDGTTNFVKDYKCSTISIALLKDEQPVMGLIYNPFLDELYTAEKGKGAKCNGKTISTTKNSLANSLVGFGTGVNDLKDLPAVWDYVGKCFDLAIDVRRSGSAAYDLCNLACGRTGYFFEFKLQPWDFSAGCLIVEEAGGSIKTNNFEPITDYFSKRQIFAFGNQEIENTLKKVRPLA